MPSSQSRGAAGVINGILYVVGGATGSTNASTNPTGLLQTFDPSANSGLGAWSTATSMPTARELLSTGVLNGLLFAVGGYDITSTALHTVEAYNPASNTWTSEPPMPTARAGLQVGVVNGVLYAAGGQDPITGTFFTTNEAFTPSAPPNAPPDCSKAAASSSFLWPPNHKFVAESITGVTDTDSDTVTTTITAISQDEPVRESGTGGGNTCPDGTGLDSSAAQIRAERDGSGDGRVYRIVFTATDSAGNSCNGQVTICVPLTNGAGCVDGGPLFDSTGPCP
jgi:hypothetical protein